MNEPTLDTVTQRLDRLERENRHLKRIGSMVILGLAALVLMGQALPKPTPKTIEAEEFVLRDSKGKKRAVLGFAPFVPASPYLGFLNEDRLSVALGIKPDGPELSLFDQRGTELVQLGVTAVGASLSLGSAGDTRVLLARGQDGTSLLSLAGKDRKGLASLIADADGTAGMFLFKGGQRARVGLRVRDDDSATLTLFDKAGKERVELATTTRGSAALAFFDQNKKSRVLISADPEPRLTLVGKDEKAIWQAP